MFFRRPTWRYERKSPTLRNKDSLHPIYRTIQQFFIKSLYVLTPLIQFQRRFNICLPSLEVVYDAPLESELHARARCFCQRMRAPSMAAPSFVATMVVYATPNAV
jgi:hypothetical protein